jgi:hypothetical protein
MHDLVMIKIQTKFAAMVWLTAWGAARAMVARKIPNNYVPFNLWSSNLKIN